MASAQVLKKQEHLEAGKKKLEEYRKKKAAEKEKAKKATLASQINNSDGGSAEKKSSEPAQAQLPDAVTASISDSVGVSFPGISPELFNRDIKDVKASINSSYTDSASNSDIDSLVPLHSLLKNNDFQRNDALQFSQHIHLNSSQPELKETGGAAEESALSDPSIPNPKFDNPSLLSTFNEINYDLPNHDDNRLKDSSGIQSSGSHPHYMNGFPDNSENILFDKPRYGDRFTSSIISSSNEDFRHSAGKNSNYFSDNGHRTNVLESNNTSVPDRGEEKSSGSSLTSGASSLAMWSPDTNYTGFSLSNDTQWSNARRSRPSFLDSINVSKGFSSSTLPETVNVEQLSTKVLHEDELGSYPLRNATHSTFASLNGVDLRKDFVEKNREDMQDHFSRRQNEDFAALEQHIEDLTQEKFHLQRTLEGSRTLADSLAAENSALTDSYNQQGSLVHQLKSDLENLQQEIKAKMVELEAVQIEYSNAQLECNAADERAKLLASEVIGLEEKALRLKSNELKLQRQLESTVAEIYSFQKRISSLEKERRDMQSTIDALQEEKKLLQSMLRKSSAGNVPKTSTDKKNVSTSTEDLVMTGDCSDAEASGSMSIREGSLGNDASNLSHLQDSAQFSLQDMAAVIPADQTRMIENINSLLSELALEKEELVQALSTESSQNHNFQDLNKELTRKLEIQTQRLELLTAQRMVNDGLPARTSDTPLVEENPIYTDEGDEVVERVLGWIMKLFPGGPSRRRNSKVL